MKKIKIKAVFFDMDGTLIKYNGRFHSSWEAIGEALGVSEEWNRMNSYYINKKHLYVEWYEKQTKPLKGLEVSKIARKIFPIPYSKGVRQTAQYIASKYLTGIITSGVNVVAEKVKDELGLDFCISNELEIVDGKFTGRTLSFSKLWDKEKNFIKACQKLELNPEEVCFIGDHLNDVPVFKAAGMSIAFNPKEKEVAENADYVIYDFKELRRIL